MEYGNTYNRPAKERTVYDEWVAAQGIPVHDGNYIRDLRTVELAPWERLGVPGAFVHHESTRTSNDCYLCEIPPAGEVKPQRHVFEEMIYILNGRGATTVWQEGGEKQTFEWQEGALFAIPLNAWSQHFNGSSRETVRYIAVTNCPVIMNQFGSADFVFNNPYVFKDRFLGEKGYFEGKGKLNGRLLSTNFVADVRTLELLDYFERGDGSRNIKLNLARNTMGAHISEFEVGSYKKAHRHGPGAHVVVLAGKGYTLMWREGEPIKRFDWQEGSLTVPGDMQFHQHFNIGNAPARYLALRLHGQREMYGGNLPLSTISIKDGGQQLDFEDQDPIVHQMFLEACAENGVDVTMDPAPFQAPALR